MIRVCFMTALERVLDLLSWRLFFQEGTLIANYSIDIWSYFSFEIGKSTQLKS